MRRQQTSGGVPWPAVAGACRDCRVRRPSPEAQAYLAAMDCPDVHRRCRRLGRSRRRRWARLTDPCSVDAAETYHRAAELPRPSRRPGRCARPAERAVRIYRDVRRSCAKAIPAPLPGASASSRRSGEKSQAAASAAHGHAGRRRARRSRRSTAPRCWVQRGTTRSPATCTLALSRVQEAGEHRAAVRRTRLGDGATWPATMPLILGHGRRRRRCDRCGRPSRARGRRRLGTRHLPRLRPPGRTLPWRCATRATVRRAAELDRPGRPTTPITGPVARSTTNGPRSTCCAGASTRHPPDRSPGRASPSPWLVNRIDVTEHGRDRRDVVRSSQARPWTVPWPCSRTASTPTPRIWAGRLDGPGRSGRRPTLVDVVAGPAGRRSLLVRLRGFGVPVRSEPVRAPPRVLRSVPPSRRPGPPRLARLSGR